MAEMLESENTEWIKMQRNKTGANVTQLVESRLLSNPAAAAAAARFRFLQVFLHSILTCDTVCMLREKLFLSSYRLSGSSPLHCKKSRTKFTVFLVLCKVQPTLIGGESWGSLPALKSLRTITVPNYGLIRVQKQWRGLERAAKEIVSTVCFCASQV